MGSSIWSADPTTFLDMPALTFARFFANHGLLDYGDQPDWRTVDGGSRRYVDAVLAPLGDRLRLGTPVQSLTRHEDGVDVTTPAGTDRFDHVVVATHSDQALALLADATAGEHEILSAIRYQPNRTTLHTDRSLLPKHEKAWASWNYHRLPDHPTEATLTYRLASLQGVRASEELLVTLNRDDAIDPAKVLRTFDYAHPVYDVGTVAAQARWHEISGTGRTWYCGAYWGYGFHEDGVESARRVCRALAGTDL
jgi:predicted NAD/FAD-binding protein